MQAILKNTLRLLVALFPLTSFAKINYRTGAYLTSAIDLEIATQAKVAAPVRFQLRRTYSSRSLHSGLFGFGWCSDLEKSLDLRNPQKIFLHDCRVPVDRVYEKRRPGWYVSLDDPDDALVLHGQEYRRKTRTMLQTFSSRGQLTSLSDLRASQHGFTLRILYDGENRITRLKFPAHPDLELTLDSSRRRITAVTQSGKTMARYEYEHGNLIAAQNFRYRYDDAHNLTLLEGPDATFEAITYDGVTDTVREVHEASGCTETMTAKTMTAKTVIAKEIVISQRKCAHQKAQLTAYRFSYPPAARERVSSIQKQGGPVP